MFCFVLLSLPLIHESICFAHRKRKQLLANEISDYTLEKCWQNFFSVFNQHSTSTITTTALTNCLLLLFAPDHSLSLSLHALRTLCLWRSLSCVHVSDEIKSTLKNCCLTIIRPLARTRRQCVQSQQLQRETESALFYIRSLLNLLLFNALLHRVAFARHNSNTKSKTTQSRK